MKKQKLRLSLLWQIVLLVLIAVVAANLLTVGYSKQIILNYAARQGKDLAIAVGTAVKTAIGSKDGFYDLLEDPEFRKEIHGTFRYICKTLDIQNLYIYTIDENEKKQYLVVASNDPEDDAELNELYAYGTDNTRPIYQAERNIMEGDEDGDYEYIENDFGKVFMYVIPVLREDGGILCYIGVDFSLARISNIAEEDLRVLYSIRIFLVTLIFAIAILLMRNLIIKPIQGVSVEMRTYVEDRRHGQGIQRKHAFFRDEISDIEDSFDKMTVDISRYLEDIEHLTEDRIQNETQLQVARNIQCGMIPEEYSLSGEYFDIYGFERPARKVGGDFYDIFQVDENRVCVIVGDISGKGISAALFMVMVKTVLREKLLAGRSLPETLMMANQEVCLANPENMFATVFAAVLDMKKGLLTYANAGHNRPVFLGETPDFMTVKPGMALGLFEDIEIEEEERYLQDGEGLLIYTDGVTEAINESRDLFGEERLLHAVKGFLGEKKGDLRAGGLVNHVITSVDRHSGEKEQFDDITCAAFLYRAGDRENMELSPDIASFRLVKQTIMESLGENENTKKIILVCEEMFANIVDYSGADNVFFSVSKSRNTYSLTFSDNGIPFDPASAPIPEKDFEELDTGGMGIKLARLHSREMIYHRAKGRNVLTLKFDVG